MRWIGTLALDRAHCIRGIFASVLCDIRLFIFVKQQIVAVESALRILQVMITPKPEPSKWKCKAKYVDTRMHLLVPKLAQIYFTVGHWSACIVTLCMISSVSRTSKEEVTPKNFYLLGVSRNSMSSFFRLQSSKALNYYWCCSILCSQMRISKECHKPVAQAERRNRKLQSL